MQKANDRHYKRAYFVGAGGIGMAALERYFLSKGWEVAGYDRTPSELTEALEKEGVDIVFDDDPALIPEAFRDPETTLVIYTPAVPHDHRGLTWLRDNGCDVKKRSKALGIVTEGSRSLCVSGTHGKTTTSSMAAHMLHQCGKGCNAFLGGVLRNYDTNFLLDPKSDIAVIEADEYDHSFLTLSPTVAVVTATDPDHLDIYGTEEAYLQAFTDFTSLIRPGGKLLQHTGLKYRPGCGQDVTVYTYDGEAEARPGLDFWASDIRRGNGTIIFDFNGPDGLKISDVELGVPVDININNAVAAMASVLLLEPDADRRKMAEAMASYEGAKRRFEFHLKRADKAIIDDYAHHPAEIEASIRSVRALYPDRRITVAFQPHLYTRTRDFAPEFAKALSLADDLILVDLYPAREEPIPGISTHTIGDLITKAMPIAYVSKEGLPALLKEKGYDILITLGAGDIIDDLPQIVADASARSNI